MPQKDREHWQQHKNISPYMTTQLYDIQHASKAFSTGHCNNAFQKICLRIIQGFPTPSPGSILDVQTFSLLWVKCHLSPWRCGGGNFWGRERTFELLLMRLEPEQAAQAMVGGEGSSSVELPQNTQQQICSVPSSRTFCCTLWHLGMTEMRIPHELTPAFFQGKLRACTSILCHQLLCLTSCSAEIHDTSSWKDHL